MDEKFDHDFQILHTGVPNLDTILGGGFPVGSFNLFAGGPGTGKTIMSQQIMFRNATPERPALHFTVLGEPVAKLLRYQSRFSFFDADKINTAIRYVDIGDVIRKEGLERGLEVILTRVERYNPSMVIIDSVRAVREISKREGDYGLRTFTNELAQTAVVWNATSFLIGEYEESELRAGPEFTMADGIMWFTWDTKENSVVRKIQAVKSRGMDIAIGLHSFKISRDGIYVFPRLSPKVSEEVIEPRERAKFGVPTLDRMMQGGIPRGESCLISGASGTGKTILCMHYAAEGLKRDEACVFLTFEEDPEAVVMRAERFGWPFARWQREGKLEILYRQPMDLTADEIIDDSRQAIERLGAKRLVVNSLSGFDLARAPADLSNFREAVYRWRLWLEAKAITVVFNTEVPESFGTLQFSPQQISFISDNIVLLRYVEIEAELRRVMAVVKMRSGGHDKALHPFQVTDRGVVVGAPIREYAGILSGVPTMVAVLGPQPFAPGLDEKETALVQALFGRGVASAEELAALMGTRKEDAERTLLSLAGRGYLVADKRDGETVYRVSMVSWAPGVSRPRQQRPGKA